MLIIVLYIIDFMVQNSQKISDISTLNANWNNESDQIVSATVEGIYIFNLNDNSSEKILDRNNNEFSKVQWLN